TSIVEQFGLADGINVDYPNYSFTDNNFTVWNGGNTTIDYRNMYLKIEVQNLTTKGNFTIENLNTGDRFIFNKEVNNQNLVLNGPVITVADDNRLRDTNRAFIKLKPGANEIKISNGTFSKVNFDFRFLYK
ncbi:phage tail family protein, partial [Staphylococcus aureus]|nr:phage tail family protein [Staphylococcus aureus]